MYIVFDFGTLFFFFYIIILFVPTMSFYSYNKLFRLQDTAFLLLSILDDFSEHAAIVHRYYIHLVYILEYALIIIYSIPANMFPKSYYTWLCPTFDVCRTYIYYT